MSNETTPAEGPVERGVGRLVEQRSCDHGCNGCDECTDYEAGDEGSRGCHECAFGKVLGCWRCGGR